MAKSKQSNESAATVKAGKVRESAPVNGERGAQAHASDSAQAEILTAEAATRLLKSDLTEAVGGPEPEETQTPPEKEPQQIPKEEPEKPQQEETEETETTPKPEETPTAPANPEAQKEVDAWKVAVAEIEQKLETAEGSEADALEQQLLDARKDLAEWQALAGQANGEEAQDGQAPAGWQEKVDKRIHKLTSEREQHKTRADQAEARAQQLEAELQSVRSARDTLAPMMDPQKLDKLAEDGRQAIDEIEAVLDGTATDEEYKRVSGFIGQQLEADVGLPRETQRALKKQLREFQETVAVGIPQEKKRVESFRAAEAQASVKAREWFPFLKDKAHPDYQQAQVVLQAMPGIRYATPAWEVAIGTYVLGLQQLRKMNPEVARLLGGSASLPRRLPRKAPGRSPASGGGAAAPNGARTRARDAEETAARSEFSKSRTAESVEKLLRVSLRA